MDQGISQKQMMIWLGLVLALAMTGVYFVPTKATEILGFCSLAVIGLVKMLQDARVASKAAAKAEEVVVKVEEVKQTQATAANDTKDQLAAIANVGMLTHDLCNSAMLEQKKLLMETSEAKAGISHNSVDWAAAKVARESYEEHLKKQQAMDLNAAKRN